LEKVMNIWLEGALEALAVASFVGALLGVMYWMLSGISLLH
jgi:hypothetical protein